MATNSQKEVDLIIRAKDLSSKALKDNKAALTEVTSALASQGSAAKTTGAALDAASASTSNLSESNKSLSRASDELKKAMASTADAIDTARERQVEANVAFDIASEKLDKHKQTVANAATAYQIFSREILDVGPPTKRQAAELAKLSTIAQGNTRDMTRLSNTVERAQASLLSATETTQRLTTGMADLQALDQQVASASAQVSKTLADQAAAAQKAAAAQDALTARMNASKAAGQALMAAGAQQAEVENARLSARLERNRQAGNAIIASARDVAAQQAAASAQADKADKAAWDARLARIRAAAQQEAAAASRALSGGAGNTIAASTAAEAAANVERGRTVTLLDKINSGNRESLSWYQRVRGEVIALATAYVGLQGALSLASGALEATRKMNSIDSTLAVAAGSIDPKAVGAEYQYIAGQADRLGVRIDDLSAAYAKFAVSSKAAGATANQTRFIFEKVAETARVLHLSTDDMNGVFLALEQMMAKGQVQAEELRGQLGERLPGAVALFAKSMYGDSKNAMAQLNKDLQSGSVTAKNLIGFAKELGTEFGKQLPSAMQNMQAQEARLYNAMFNFKKLIADMGFAEAWTKFVVDLTNILKSDDGTRFAKSFSDAFTTVVNILGVVIKNFNVISDVITLVFGVKVLSMVGGFASKLTEAAFALGAVGTSGAAAAVGTGAAAGAMDAAAVAAANLNKALGLISRAFLLITAAFTGWEIGKILGDKFETARLAGTAAAEGLTNAWIQVKYGVLVAIASLVDSLTQKFADGLNAFNDLKNGFLGKLKSGADALGLTSVADSLAKSITTGVGDGMKAARDLASKNLASIRAERDKALKDNRDAYTQMYIADLRRPELRLSQTPPQPTALTDTSGGLYDLTGLPKKGKADKVATVQQSLSEQLNQLWKSVEKGQKDSLDSQLEAVNRTYKKIYDTIAKYQKLGGTTVDGRPLSEIKAELQTIQQQAIQQATLTFNTDQLKKKEQEVNDVVKERKDFNDDIQNQIKAQTISAADGFKAIAAQADKTQPKLAQMAKDAAAFANGVRGTGIPDAKIDAFVSKMTRIGNEPATGGASDASAAGLAIYNSQLADLNSMLGERNSNVELYNNLVKVGAITQDDANQKIKAAYEDSTPKIQTLIGNMRELLVAMQSAGDITQTKFDSLNAKLTEVSQQTQYVDKDMATLRNTVIQGLGNGAVQQVDNLTDSIFKAVDGTESWGEAFRNIGVSLGQFIAQFMRQIADAIAQIYAMKIAMSVLGMFSGGIGSLGGSLAGGSLGGSSGLAGALSGASTDASILAPIAHSGTMVGRPGGTSRRALASWFTNAPRAHSGTLVGLKPDEEAYILQRGEEVLSKDNPRNLMNQTAANAKRAADSPISIRNNLVADPNFVPDAMNTAAGEKVLWTWLRSNKIGIKSFLK